MPEIINADFTRLLFSLVIFLVWIETKEILIFTNLALVS